jgi:hypothetical protein
MDIIFLEQTGSYEKPVIDMILEVHITIAGSPYGGVIRITVHRRIKYARIASLSICHIIY